MKISSNSAQNIGIFHATNLASSKLKSISNAINERYESMSISKEGMQKLKARALEKANKLEIAMAEKIKKLESRMSLLNEYKEINKGLEKDFDVIAKAREKLKKDGKSEQISGTLDEIENSQENQDEGIGIDWEKATEKEIYDYLFKDLDGLSEEVKDKIMTLIQGVVGAEKKKAEDLGEKYNPEESVVDALARGIGSGNMKLMKLGMQTMDTFLTEEIARLDKEIEKINTQLTLLLDNPEKSIRGEYVKNPYV